MLHQVRLPPEGSRLIVASDGVWDAFEKTSKIPVMSRAWSVSVRRRSAGSSHLSNSKGLGHC